MAVPLGMKNPKIYYPVERCGFFDENLDYSTFKTYRDIYDDTYDYIVPPSNNYLPSYVTKTRVNPFPNRPNQDEVELIISKKMVEERVLVKNLFASSAKNKDGYVTRSELFAILLKLCPNLKFDQFEAILQKCNLDKLTVYFFDTIEKEFKSLVKRPIYFADCDAFGDTRNIKATNALFRLRLAALQETFDMKELLPSSCFEPDGLLLMPQLREALCRIDIRLSDVEYSRLWEKFDKSNVGSVPMSTLFQMLNLQDNGKPMCGIRKPPEIRLRQKQSNAMKRPPITDTYKCLKNPLEDGFKNIGAGGVSFPITRVHGWVPQGMGGTNEPELGKGTRYLAGLKSLMGDHPKYDSVYENLYYIFEAPYQAMLVVFNHYDNKNRGKITIEEALEIFLEYGFSITLKDFAAFLKSTGCIFDHSFVQYRKLLENFQTKPELSFIDRRIKHIIKTQYEDIGLKTLTTMSPQEIETHFIKILHGPYMKLMEELQKHGDAKYTIDPETFRQILTKTIFHEEIPRRQWDEAFKSLELDSSTGRILYKPFLYSFSKPGRKCKPLCPMPEMKVSTDKNWDTSKYEPPQRNFLYLCIKIEKLLKRRFHFIDKYYKYFDKAQMKNFTESQFFDLLKHEKSDITASELRTVWRIMENVQPNETSYQEVIKFMMMQLVKIARQLKIKERIDSKKGFFDRNIEILQNFKANLKIEKENERQKLINKIDLSLKSTTYDPLKIDVTEICEKIRPLMHKHWEDIKAYFIKLDIIGSTTFEDHEMHTFSHKYFLPLSKSEISNLIKRFDINKNGRFHYVEFLKQFRLPKPDEMSLTKFDSYTHKLVDKKSKAVYNLSEIREILRHSMIKKWKNLLSAFKKMDHCKEGLLTIDQINNVLKENKIFLKKDDLYHILTNFDKNMDRKIDYYEFIHEILDINLVAVN